jgi:hypothetical protein
MPVRRRQEPTSRDTVIRTFTLTTCALVAATLLFACAFVKKAMSPPPIQEQRLPAVPTPAPRPESTPSPRKRHRHRHRHSHAVRPLPPATEEPVESPTPPELRSGSPSPAAAPTSAMPLLPSPTPTPARPALSIKGDNASGSRARGWVAQVDSNLSMVKRQNLSGDDAAAYDQARSLADAAQSAIKQGDYLAASGLAEKAVLLSDRFAERGGATP